MDAKTIPLLYQGLKLNSRIYSRDHPFSVLEDLGLFFSIIRKNTHVKNLELAEALAASMVERNWHQGLIESLIVPIATPIIENLRICQISPKTTYSLDTYALIDRPDLYEFAKGTYVMPDTPAIDYRKPVRVTIIPFCCCTKTMTQKHPIGELAREASRYASGGIEVNATSGGLVKDSFMDIKWTDDRRLEEVQLILQSSRTPVVKIQYSSQLPKYGFSADKFRQLIILSVSTKRRTPPLSLGYQNALYLFHQEGHCLPMDAYLRPLQKLILSPKSNFLFESCR